MGSQYRFTCESCGFEATASGGFDFGFACATQTYSCTGCGILFDQTVSREPWSFDPTKVPDKVRCRRARKTGRHDAVKWNHPGPCPKCGTFLDREDEPSVMWD